MLKTIIQIGGAILSGLWTAVSLAADVSGLAPDLPWQYHALIAFIAFVLFLGWIIGAKQLEINDLKGQVRLIAFPSRLTQNWTSKDKPIAKDEACFTIEVKFEIWANIDVHTSRIGVNMVGYRNIKPRWKFWNWPVRKRIFRALIKDRQSGYYRKTIKSTDPQPFTDFVEFTWRGKRDIFKNWDFAVYELALELGVPKRTLRTYIDENPWRDEELLAPL